MAQRRRNMNIFASFSDIFMVTSKFRQAKVSKSLVKSVTRYISSSQCLGCPPKLRVTPLSGLADELVDIRATGLDAGQPVVLRSEVYTECGRYGFEAHARYTADHKGDVSVSTQPSHEGTYRGIEPMGLLSGVKASPAHAPKYPRIMKFNPATPLVYKLSMHRGEDGDDGVLDSVSVERNYIAPYVEHLEVECGGAKGTLYLPKKGGRTPLPLIIEMPGMGPTWARERFPLLASHGFGVFEFHYYETLKDALETKGNAYFKCELLMDIVNFAKEHPDLDESRVGLNGTCYGGALALNAAARNPNLPIRCLGVQRCNDMLAVYTGITTVSGQRIDPAPDPKSYASVTRRDDGHEWFEFDFDHYVHDMECKEDYVAPAENIKVPTMFLICGDDRQCASEKCMRRSESRIREAGKSDLLEVHYLEGAGHLLDSPYFPFCRHSRIQMPIHDKPTLVDWGGDPVLHAKAQVTAWQKTINFYRRHLGADDDWRKDWHDND